MNNHDGEIDPKGKETLQSIAVASRFNEWMYRTIKPYCKGRILEIGSGIGNISAFFIRDGFPIVLSDLNKDYCQLLHQQFEGEPGCQDITELDLVHPDFDQIYAAYLSSFDTVIALNVIEHIQDEAAAFRNAKKLLVDGGNLVVLVPAYNFLFNDFDKALQHYRRYTKKSLLKAMSPYFEILHTQYFNAAGIPGWFVSGSVLKHETIATSQMKLFDKMVPAFKFLDKMLVNQVGLSVIAVGQKLNK